ncbi:MAG: polyketide antibiotic transporter, partial [Actinomycetota bacterium]|nr:polyketide antibiotic transporter [Actinomycetota bacterium]
MIRLLALQARRDRVTLAIWVLAIAVLAAGSASAVATEFSGSVARAAVLKLGLATPSLLALRGIPNGDSAGSLLWFQVFAFLAVAVGLMNT